MESRWVRWGCGVRHLMCVELHALARSIRATTVRDATTNGGMAMADRIAVMNHGCRADR